MKFTSKLLKEEVVIKAYSVQAIARKRNSMMNALELNDTEFLNWVRDRLYRVAEQNKVPVKDLKIDTISDGLAKWENTFRQGDQKFDEYRDQFSEYQKKFLSSATGIMRDNTTNPTPDQLNPSAEQVPPISPKMVKYQASDNK